MYELKEVYVTELDRDETEGEKRYVFVYADLEARPVEIKRDVAADITYENYKKTGYYGAMLPESLNDLTFVGHTPDGDRYVATDNYDIIWDDGENSIVRYVNAPDLYGYGQSDKEGIKPVQMFHEYLPAEVLLSTIDGWRQFYANHSQILLEKMYMRLYKAASWAIRAKGVSKVSPEYSAYIIDTREPIGLFYVHNDDDTYTAIDNTTGNAWTEDFSSERACVHWLTHSNL